MKITITNQKSKIKNIKGFSLIELVFAMSFLTLIVFGVVRLQSSNLAMMGGNNNQIQANLYANQSLQIIKGLGYNAVKTACASPPCSKKLKNNGSSYSLEDSAPSDNPLFERTIEISDDNLTSAYLVKVIIEWEDATGEHKKSNNSHVEAKQIIY